MATTRISFDREAGVDLLGGTPGDKGDASRLGPAIEAHLGRLGVRAEQFELAYDAIKGVVTLTGLAGNQDMRERLVLCIGNVRGVAAVDDLMTVIMPSDVSRWHFVQPGDTLTRIAHDVYRDPSRVQQLRAANQPLIGDGEALPAGWLLRVPA